MVEILCHYYHHYDHCALTTICMYKYSYGTIHMKSCAITQLCVYVFMRVVCVCFVLCMLCVCMCEMIINIYVDGRSFES